MPRNKQVFMLAALGSSFCLAIFPSWLYVRFVAVGSVTLPELASPLHSPSLNSEEQDGKGRMVSWIRSGARGYRKKWDKAWRQGQERAQAGYKNGMFVCKVSRSL